MLWIGLTGGLGTGKSTAAQLLQARGFRVIDADQLAHAALNPNTPSYKDIVNHFGTSILNDDSSIDRKKLAQKVFDNQTELRFLESIVHPFVQKQVSSLRKRAKDDGCNAVFYDVPLLYEKNMQSQFDQVWVVSASLEKQLERLKLRNQWSEDEIKKRLANQLHLNEKIKMANVVLKNDSDKQSLAHQIDEELKKLALI